MWLVQCRSVPKNFGGWETKSTNPYQVAITDLDSISATFLMSKIIARPDSEYLRDLCKELVELGRVEVQGAVNWDGKVDSKASSGARQPKFPPEHLRVTAL